MPTSRKQFLKLAGGSGAAALGSALVACGGSSGNGATTGPTAQEESGDIAIVNFALTLEYLETDFYAKAIDTGFFKGSQLDLLKAIGESEQQHVDALTAAVGKLGGAPAKRPKTKFPLADKTTIVKAAQRIENLGAAAYLGQAPRIKDKDIFAAALSIHTVEARHAAALNTLLGKDIAPTGAFAKPASMDEVLSVAKLFIVG
jgi:rubrerythrin